MRVTRNEGYKIKLKRLTLDIHSSIYQFEMVFIYALQLEGGKYYVGKTNNPQIRLEQHCRSTGSEWTKMYKPIKVLEVIPNCDNYDEDKYTRIYMDKYGVDNVRGGSFVTTTLDKHQKELLTQMRNGSNDKCFVCGKGGHFARDCQEEKHCEVVWVCEPCGKEFAEERECINHVNYCQGGERDEDGDEESDEDGDEDSGEDEWIWGCEYCSEEFEDEHECINHEKYCSRKNKKKMTSKRSDHFTSACFRCGREGHYASSCYASKDINGHYL